MQRFPTLDNPDTYFCSGEGTHNILNLLALEKENKQKKKIKKKRIYLVLKEKDIGTKQGLEMEAEVKKI